MSEEVLQKLLDKIESLEKQIQELQKEKKTINLQRPRKISLQDLKTEEELSAEVENHIDQAVDLLLKYAKAVDFS